ncbi:heterokaryon incompatibility protein-domain-containing protein [Corynascus similis CBS 632.67]
MICNESHQPNAQLCSDCQPWDDFTYLIECESSTHARLDPSNFSRRSETINTWRTGRSDAFPHTIQDLPYRDLGLIESRTQCMICRAVGQLLLEFKLQTYDSPKLGFGAWQPFVVHADSACKQQLVDEGDAPDESLTELCILPGAILWENDTGTVSYTPVTLKLLLRYREIRRGLLSVRRWTPQPLSLSNLTKWFENCHKHHGETCNALITRSRTVPQGFRLIDTTTNSIVQCAERVGYAALSYCWPSTAATATSYLQLQLHNADQLSQMNGLDVGRLFPVIADAIRLCKDLGKRYLWVDQLCIVQDDPVSKFSQIQAMDSIYNMADFTVVALSSAPGLPGVSSRPRDSSFDAIYGLWDGGFQLPRGEATAPFADWAIERSRWDTRGWTFQERKLSRRLVFVDGLHAYFSCFQGSFWEHDQRALSTVYQPIPSHNTVDTGLHGSRSFSEYAHLAVPYSKRQLSFRSDKLNAFTGVGTILAFRFETSLLFGLPEKYLLQSLLWRSDDCSQGRDPSLGFPSWSWAAWDGSVDYGFSKDIEFLERGVILDGYAMGAFKPWHTHEMGSLVTFYYSDYSPIVREVDETLLWFTEGEMNIAEYAEWQDFLHGGPGNQTSYIRATKVTDTWDRCCHNPSEALRRIDIAHEAREKAAATPGCLAFTTTCALLTLRQAMRVKASTSPAVYFDMYTTAKNGNPARFVGQTMLMERKWAERTLDVSRSYSVIVLGAGEASGADENGRLVWTRLTGGVSMTAGLYVMIAEERDGVLYRLAVGVVDPLAWNEANPTWKSVVLA